MPDREYDESDYPSLADEDFGAYMSENLYQLEDQFSDEDNDSTLFTENAPRSVYEALRVLKAEATFRLSPSYQKFAKAYTS